MTFTMHFKLCDHTCRDLKVENMLLDASMDIKIIGEFKF